MHARSEEPQTHFRGKVIFIAICTVMGAITLRLGYWQIVRGESLRTASDTQITTQLALQGNRGSIFSADGQLLVGNREYFQVFVRPKEITIAPKTVAELLSTIISSDTFEQTLATPSGTESVKAKQAFLENRLQSDKNWVLLDGKITQETKAKIEELKLSGIGFEPLVDRAYPEASLAAHLVGFVGKNEDNSPKGYFGVEGALQVELSGKQSNQFVTTDALGKLLAGEQTHEQLATSGRDVVLTIRRDVQFMAESYLDWGMQKYGAAVGEILIMEPSTGRILAYAQQPSYDPLLYYLYPTSLFRNSALSDTYEPGSTFKTLTVAAGIDTNAITPETLCEHCAGPRTIGKYTIKTWNNEYHPNISVRDALAKSDNTAMIEITDKLGSDRFVEYLHRFKIGEPIHIDLQGDGETPFPQKWGPVELATASFGQGISATTFQMVRAVGALANDGMMVRPRIIEKVIDHQLQQEIPQQTVTEGRVVTSATARVMTELMVYAAAKGEAQWTAAKTYTVAGKTGTSQIAHEGGYLEDSTIASFIGFAPAQKPRFIMMVKLVAPQSSPWAAETAAPLWYKVADKLFLLLNIAPS